MIIPDSIKVLGHEYSVIKEPHLFKRTEAGACCPGTLEIRIDSTFAESKQAETFMHEIFEAMKYHLQSDMQHETITQLSELLFSIVRRNGLDFRKP